MRVQTVSKDVIEDKDRAFLIGRGLMLFLWGAFLRLRLRIYGRQR